MEHLPELARKAIWAAESALPQLLPLLPLLPLPVLMPLPLLLPLQVTILLLQYCCYISLLHAAALEVGLARMLDKPLCLSMDRG